MELLKQIGWWAFLLGGLAVLAGIGVAWYVSHIRHVRERENRAWKEHQAWLNQSKKTGGRTRS